nr:thioredoxin-dependent thiol peroxidase [Gorillibacterium massiliense]
MEEKLKVGKPVPNFTLPSSEGRDISLKDYRGKKLVIYFYPKDMTPACTQEACDFRDMSPMLKTAGFEVIGVSVDNVKTHGKFKDKYALPFPLLSDEQHQMSEGFGVWQKKKLAGREYMGVVRSTFLVDEEGNLIQEWRNIRVKDHVQQVLAAAEKH